MASEDIFHEYTEEIVISELAQEDVNDAAAEIEEETEDFTAILNQETEEDEHIEEKNEKNNATEEISTTEQENTENDKPTEQSINAQQSTDREAKLVQLPLSRIRNIMKLDPDLNIASNEALFAVTRCTELFIESLAREAYVHTQQAKKKTVQKRDVDMAIAAVDSLMFLEGAMNF